MSSPDVRTVDYELDLTKVKMLRDPYWPPLGFSFDVSPAEIDDWATKIFHASNFLDQFGD